MIEDDFPPDVVAFLKQELEKFKGKCYYSSAIKKIVYMNHNYAMEAYMSFQVREMEKHKWVESEKAGHDLGEKVLIDWDRRFAPSFSEFWKRTHSFVPVKVASS